MSAGAYLAEHYRRASRQGPRCVKCGSRDIYTVWHLETHGTGRNTCSWFDQWADGQWGEHLHRYCRGCSFQWRDPIVKETA